SRPRAGSAALCMMGDSEWVTGSPITASSRVLALISAARKLFDDPLHRRVDKGLERDAGVAVDLEVASERVAHLCGVALAPGVLAQHEDMALAAQLVDAGAMMAGHGQDEIRLVDQLPREQTGAVRREVEPALQPHEIRALRHGRPVPRPGPGGRHLQAVDAALRQGALQQGGGQRAAADVAGADEQDPLHFRVLHYGASRPAARRSSASVIAPSRTSRASGCVQSTTVEGGEFPNTPPSSTSSVPAATAAAKSRMIAAAPGAGGWPGRLAEVDVIGSPRACTSCAIPRCDVQRTAIPPSGPRSRSGSRPLPPGSTSDRGPGQNARASALAAALNARPCASAMSRSLTSRRNGLSGRRPLRCCSATTSASSGREPTPYTVSV